MRREGSAAELDEDDEIDIDSVKYALQAEQNEVQKRTFTNWVNAQLSKHKSPSVVQDLYQDLRDGLQLLDLLEVLSGQQLERERKNTHLIHWRANVQSALKFLMANSIKLVNINVPDIVEGKSNIILGLVWSIISHFQVEKLAMGLELDSAEGVPSAPVTASPTGTPPVKRGRFHSKWKWSAKKALLQWVQEKTRDQPVTIQDLSGSWRDGLAFAAVINALCPGLLSIAKLRHQSDSEKLETVFRTAENQLGIPRLLDAQDFALQKPDEKSIITYLSQFLEYSKALPVDELDTKEPLSAQDTENSTLQTDVRRDFEESRKQVEACIQGAVQFLQDEGTPQELIAKHQETIRAFDSGTLCRFLAATDVLQATASPQKRQAVSELREELRRKWAMVQPAVAAHLQRLDSAVGHMATGRAHRQSETGTEAEPGNPSVCRRSDPAQQTPAGEGAGSMEGEPRLVTGQQAESASAYRVSVTGCERSPGRLEEATGAGTPMTGEVRREGELLQARPREELGQLAGMEWCGDPARTVTGAGKEDQKPAELRATKCSGGSEAVLPPGMAWGDLAEGVPGAGLESRHPTRVVEGSPAASKAPVVEGDCSAPPCYLSCSLNEDGQNMLQEASELEGGKEADNLRQRLGVLRRWELDTAGVAPCSVQPAGIQGGVVTVDAGQTGALVGPGTVGPVEKGPPANLESLAGPLSVNKGGYQSWSESPEPWGAGDSGTGGGNWPLGLGKEEGSVPPTAGGFRVQGQGLPGGNPGPCPTQAAGSGLPSSGSLAWGYHSHEQSTQRAKGPQPTTVPEDKHEQDCGTVTWSARVEGVSPRAEAQSGCSPPGKGPVVWDRKVRVPSGELPAAPRDITAPRDDGVRAKGLGAVPCGVSSQLSAGGLPEVGSSELDFDVGQPPQENGRESLPGERQPVLNYSHPLGGPSDCRRAAYAPAGEGCGRSPEMMEEESFGIPVLSLTDRRGIELQGLEEQEGEGRSSRDVVTRYETAEDLEQMLKRLGTWGGLDPHCQPTLLDLREKLQEVQAAQSEVTSCLSESDAELMEERGMDPYMLPSATRSGREDLVQLQQALQRRERSLSSVLGTLEGVEEEILPLQDSLLQFQNQPVVLSGHNLKLEPHLELLKQLQTAVETLMEGCEAVCGERPDSLEPVDYRAVRSIAQAYAQRCQEMGAQTQAAAAALRDLDRFLRSLWATEPRDGAGRGQQAETPGLRLEEEAERLRVRARQLDETLEAAGLRLGDRSPGGRVRCQDLVAVLDRERDATGREEHLPQEKVRVGQERLTQHLQEIEQCAQATLLPEATVPAIQGRLDALKELECELQQAEQELAQLREMAQQLVTSNPSLAGETQQMVQTATEAWTVTAGNLQDWQDQCSILVDFLREFQTHKKDLLSTIEKGKNLTARHSSYMTKEKLQQLVRDVDEARQDLSDKQEILDKLKNVCWRLQSNLRRITESESLPFQREAENLVDQWLDVTERLENYGCSLQQALSLWDNLTECGRRMGERVLRREDPLGESVSHRGPVPLDGGSADQARAREQEVHSFREKVLRIQKLLEWEEVPLELQVLESALCKELEQMSGGQRDPGGHPTQTEARVETTPASIPTNALEKQVGQFSLDDREGGEQCSAEAWVEQEEAMWSDDDVTPTAEELPQILPMEEGSSGDCELPQRGEQGAGPADDPVPMAGARAQPLQDEGCWNEIPDTGDLVDRLRAEQGSTESSAQRIGESHTCMAEEAREGKGVPWETIGVSDWLQHSTFLPDAGGSESDGEPEDGEEGVQGALSPQREVAAESRVEWYIPISTEIPAPLQQTARASDNMDEEVGVQGGRAEELRTRIVECTGRLQELEETLWQQSRTVGEAKAQLKFIWSEVDAWHSVLSQLDGDVQELAEEDPAPAQQLMDSLLDSFQLYQQVSQLAEQRSALVNKIPECLQEFQQVMDSATSWIQSTEDLLSQNIDCTSAKSLNKQLFTVQKLAENNRQKETSLRDLNSRLRELSMTIHTDDMMAAVKKLQDSGVSLQQGLAQRASEIQTVTTEIEALESEVKNLESNVSAVKDILQSTDLCHLPIQEHLTNRQVILASLEEVRRMAGPLAEYRNTLVLPEGYSGNIQAFTRVARVSAEINPLQELTMRQSSLLESLLEKLQDCDAEVERLQKDGGSESQGEMLAELGERRQSLVISTQEALLKVTQNLTEGQGPPSPKAEPSRGPEANNVPGKLSSLLEEDEGESEETMEGTQSSAPPPDVDRGALQGLDECQQQVLELERRLESTRELPGSGAWTLTMQGSVEEHLQKIQNTLVEIEEKVEQLTEKSLEQGAGSQLASLSERLASLRGSLLAMQARLAQGQISSQEWEAELTGEACPTEAITQQNKTTGQSPLGEEPSSPIHIVRDNGDPVSLGIATSVDLDKVSPPLAVMWQHLQCQNQDMAKLLKDSLQQSQGSQAEFMAEGLHRVPGLAQPAVALLSSLMAELEQQRQEAEELAAQTEGAVQQDARLTLKTAVQRIAHRVSDWLDGAQAELYAGSLVPLEEAEQQLQHHQVLLESLETAHQEMAEEVEALGQSDLFSCPEARGSLTDLHNRLGLFIRSCCQLTHSLRADVDQASECQTKLKQLQAALSERRAIVQHQLLESTGCSLDEQLQWVEGLAAELLRLEGSLLELTGTMGRWSAGPRWEQEVNVLEEALEDSWTWVGEQRKEIQHCLLLGRQHEGLLRGLVSLLESGQVTAALEEPLPFRSISELQTHLQRYKLFFQRLEGHVSVAEQFSKAVPERVVALHRERWSELMNRHVEMQSKALRWGVHMETTLQVWTELEAEREALTKEVETLNSRLPSVGLVEETKEHVAEVIGTLQHIRGSLMDSWPRMEEVLRSGRALLEVVESPELEAHFRALEDAWLSLRNRLHQELHRLETLLEQWNWFQRESGGLGEWLDQAGNQVIYWKQELLSVPSDAESRRNQLKLFLGFRKEVEERTPSGAVVASSGRRLLGLQRTPSAALQEQLDQLERRWAQLAGELPPIQEWLLQLQVEGMPSRLLLAELLEWVGGVDTRLRAAAEVPALGSSAAVSQELRDCQRQKLEVSCWQPAVDSVNHSLLQVRDGDVEGSRYSKMELAEQLGTLNLHWEALCHNLNSRVQKLDLALETWTDLERKVQLLASWLGTQAKHLENIREASSYTSILDSLTDCQKLCEQLKVKEKEFEQLRETVVQETRQAPPETQGESAATLDRLQAEFRSLAVEVSQVESVLASRSQLWTAYQDAYKQVNVNIIWVRYTLEHWTSLCPSLETARIVVNKLQSLQDMMDGGEGSWRKFLEVSQRLQEECCPMMKAQLENRAQDTERRWAGINQDVSEQLRLAGTLLLLWQQFSSAHGRVLEKVRATEKQCGWLLAAISAKESTLERLQVRLRSTQDSANNLKTLEQGILPLREAADELAGHLDPSSPAAVQSDAQHVSGRVSRLLELLSVKAQEIQGLLEQRQEFQRGTEHLERLLDRWEEAVGTDGVGPQVVGQAWAEMVKASVILGSVRHLGIVLEGDRCRVRDLERRWKRAWDTAWTVCSRLQGAGEPDHEYWSHLWRELEEKLVVGLPGRLEWLEAHQLKPEHDATAWGEGEAGPPGNLEHLESHEGLQMEVGPVGQMAEGIDSEKSQPSPAEGPHSGPSECQWSELRVRTDCWLRYHESRAGLQRLLAGVRPRLRAMDRLGHYTLPEAWALQDELQHEERILNRHKGCYLQTVELGRQLPSAANTQTQSVLREQLGQLKEGWEWASTRVKENAARLAKIQEECTGCDREVAVLGPAFQEIWRDLKRALPRSIEDLQREQSRLQELEQTLEPWNSRLVELSSKKTFLGAHLVLSSAIGFQEQVTQLENQWEQLRLEGFARGQGIIRGLEQWDLFKTRSEELGAWLKTMVDKVTQSTGTGIEETIEKLQKDCAAEIARWQTSRQMVQRLGEGLKEACDPARASEVDSKLQSIAARWGHFNQLIDSRVKTLMERQISVQNLDGEMSCLRSWLAHIEAELSKPLVYTVCDDQEIERKLAEQQELQRDIDHHAAGVESVLRRSNGILLCAEAEADAETECDSLRQSSSSLDRRWRNICALSLQRRMRIEETWRMWQKILDDYSHFEEWLRGAEETAAHPNTSLIPYSLAKDELKKYETFQRQAHERLTQLELINKQFRRLCRENRADTSRRLRQIVAQGNRRWDALQRRITAILRRLKHFIGQREEFESSRKAIEVWLTEMDLQLTNVEHFSQSDIVDKVRQLNAFQQEITLNTNKIDQLIVSGEQLIQKMEPLDAVDIEEELEELHAYCQEVCEDVDPCLREAEGFEGAGDRLEPGEVSLSVPDPPDSVPQHRSGRETPVSVDSIPLEWDHTVDVGGSSSQDEDEFLSPLASGDLAQESTVWHPNTSGDRVRTSGQRAETGPPCDSTHRQDYAKLLSEGIGSTEDVQRVPDDLKNNFPQDAGSVEMDVSDQPMAGVVRWNLLHAQALSKELLVKQNLQQWQQFNSDLDHVSAWLSHVAPVLEGVRTPEAPSTLAAIQEKMRSLGDIQKDLGKYKALVVSANLSSRELVQSGSDEARGLQDRLHSVNGHWNRLTQELHNCWDSLRGDLLQSQDVWYTTRSVQTWLANCAERRERLQPTAPTLGMQTLAQQRRHLLALQEEMLGRQPQILGLEELGRRLLDNPQGPRQREAREKICAIASKARLLLQGVAGDLQEVDERLDASSIMSVEELDVTGVPQTSTPLRHLSGLREAPSVSTPRSAPVTAEQTSPRGRPFLGRVLRAALPLQLLLLLLLLLASLLPLQQPEYSCSVANNFARSLYPMLRYTHGPPPT
ncbi:nesprin-2-like isoform X3 [Hypanus sabinus]|uniref:nesprin-2-like isoform X3 n=1 Tax=Hypanus sabinus TaxID=79690 RepID=UPI0028C4CE7F|nr:nesprin-2-like isoform X3 [Hypanus sabinus]